MRIRAFFGKKLLLTLLCLLLVGMVATGSSLAYLHAVTRDYQNAFSLAGEDLRARLTEPNWDAAEGLRLVPGKTIRKDPIITNTSKDQSEYVAVRMKIFTGSGALFSSAELLRLLHLMRIEGLSARWVLCAGSYQQTSGTVTSAAQPLVFYYDQALAPGEVTEPLFTALRVQNKYDNDHPMTEADLNWLKSLGTIDLKLEGAAVDAGSFPAAANAADTLVGLFP
ncbi:MAG: hypothetical protein LBG83_00560 [Oscillospiraceae bacterium]|jgi:hypothetical protein|nr:hypothetical protein [Oscillospiraceae bacterium]